MDAGEAALAGAWACIFGAIIGIVIWAATEVGGDGACDGGDEYGPMTAECKPAGTWCETVAAEMGWEAVEGGPCERWIRGGSAGLGMDWDDRGGSGGYGEGGRRNG